MFPSHVMGSFATKQTPISYGLRPYPFDQPSIYDWYRMFPSHVMGTFGTKQTPISYGLRP